MFNAFVSTWAVTFCTTHKKNRTCGFGTEGFVTVSSLCVVVGSPSRFIKCLIGRTVNILSVMYMNEKCIYSSKTLACTIIECAIVCDVRHVTSIWPFISWWSVAANISRTTRKERPS